MPKIKHQDVVTAIRTGKMTPDDVRGWLEKSGNSLIDEQGKPVPFQEPRPLEGDNGLSLSDVGGMALDFGKGVYDSTIGGLASLAGSAIDPQMNAGGVSVPIPELVPGAAHVLGPLLSIGQGQAASTKAMATKAGERIGEGERILAEKGASGLLPALGQSAAAGMDLASSVIPGASQFGQAAERLDRPEQIPGAAGQMFGMVAGPAAAAKVISKLPRLAEVPEGGVTGRVANAIEQTIPGKQAFGKVRAKQLEGAKSAVDAENAARTSAYETEKARVAKESADLDAAHAVAKDRYSEAQAGQVSRLRGTVRDLSPNANLDPADFAVAATDEISGNKRAASAAFNDADVSLNTGKEGIIPVPQLKQVAHNLRQEVEQAHAVPLSDRTNTIEWLRGIEGMPDKLTYAQAQNALSDLMKAERKMAASGGLASRAGKERIAVSEALRRDLDSSLDKLTGQGLDPRIVENLQKAKGTWRDLHRPAVQDLTERLKTDPESAHKILLENATTAEDIGHIKKVMPKPLWENMKVLAIKDLIEPFIKTKALTDEATGVSSLHEVLAGESGLNNVRLRAKLYKLLPQPVADRIMDGLRESATTKPPLKPTYPEGPARPEMLPQPKPYAAAVPSTFASVYNALHNAATTALSIGAGGSLALGSLGRMAESVSGSVASAGHHAVSPVILGGAGAMAAADVALWSMAKMLTNPRFANTFTSAIKSAASGNRMAVAQALGRMAAQAEPELERAAEERKSKSVSGVPAGVPEAANPMQSLPQLQ